MIRELSSCCPEFTDRYVYCDRGETFLYNVDNYLQDCRDCGPEDYSLIFTVVKTSNLVSNVVVKWLTLVLRIRDVPGSNLGPETGYPD
jgi:hypothetical protein